MMRQVSCIVRSASYFHHVPHASDGNANVILLVLTSTYSTPLSSLCNSLANSKCFELPRKVLVARNKEDRIVTRHFASVVCICLQSSQSHAKRNLGTTAMSDTDTTPPKKGKIKNKKIHQKFRHAWLSIPEFKYWLQPVPHDLYKAKCQLCTAVMRADISVIKCHSKSTKHRSLENSKTTTSSRVMTDFLTNNNEEERQLTEQTKKAEICLCGWLVEHNISFQAVDHLQEILKKVFPDSKIAKNLALKRTKATMIVRNVIGESEKSELASQLQTTRFSVLTDESTDISTTKTSCVVVRYFNENTCTITSKFWELAQVLKPGDTNNGNAEHLYKLIISTFENRKIPMTNIIGFGSDGCNLMMGQHNSVSSRFKNSCPGITIMSCICHSLHLCASEACKQLPRTCEDFARNVHNFFSASSKRQCEYVQFQMFTDTNVHKILHPSQTRSLTSVVNRLLEQWDALQLYFNEQWLQQKLVSAEQIHINLGDPFLKLYFLFLQWILPKFTQLNQYFQSDKVIITDIHEIMEETYRDLLSSYMDRTYVYNTALKNVDPENNSKFLPTSTIYLGVKVMVELKNNKIKERPDLIEYFYNKCLTFLTTACCQIRKRYNFEDSILALIGILKPKRAVSNNERCTTPSLLPLLSVLPRLANEVDYQKIDDEWRRLPFYNLEDIVKCDIDVFWGKVLFIKNEGEQLLFSNVARFALNVCHFHTQTQSANEFSVKLI